MLEKNKSAKRIRKPVTTDTLILKELKAQTKLLSEIRFIVDAQWRERRPE